jgi:hypothetical protein
MTFSSRFSAEALEFLADAYINLKLTASDSAVLFSSGPTNEKCHLEGVATCTTAYQAANKTYVDAVAQGLAVKAPVVVVSVADVDLNSLANGSTVNGVVLQTGNRILLRSQTNQVDNGIYVITPNANPPRAADMAIGSHPAGSFCFSESGTLYADAGFVCTSDAAAVVGTDALAFEQFSQAGVIQAGTNLNKVGTVLNLDDAISLTSVTTHTLALTGASSISSTTGAISFVSTSINTTGDVSASSIAASVGGSFGASLLLAAGSISDNSGAISFGSTSLNTTGGVSADAVTATAGATFGGTLELASASITDTGGAISFGSTDLATTGDVSGASFTSTSDARLKENIRVLQDPLEKVRGLRGVSFDWIETKQADVGVLAQDVQQVLPELVRASDDGTLRVDYSKLAAVLIEAVKLLELKVLALEARQLA